VNTETRNTLLGLVLGFLILSTMFAMIYSPVDELPSVATPPNLPPRLLAVQGAPAPGETRIIVLGASLTAGYPYAPELAGSYARLLGEGLRGIHPDKKILCEAWARPALDSSRLVEMCERALALEPTLLIVTLGSNEFANRVFSGEALVPGNPIDRISEKLSRSRIPFELLAQSLKTSAGNGKGKEQQAQEQKILKRIFESAPGQPGLSGLPISRDDQDLLLARLRNSMGRIDSLCKQARTPLVFSVANYALGGFWPWGVSEGGRDPVVDELVARYRQGKSVSLLPRVVEALTTRSRRADLRFLHGRLLQEAGRSEQARAEFDAARDLDGVPMHLTGEIRRTVIERSKELSREFLFLDTPLEALGQGGIPPRSFYLDYGHLDRSGHAELALWLAQRLGEGGYLPALGAAREGWREKFRTAMRHHQETGLTAESRRQAGPRMASANGAFSMLFGNYRDALPYLVTAFEGCLPPSKPEISIRLATCLLRLSGRDKELEGMGHEEGRQVYVQYFEAFQKAQKAGNLSELVERLRQGAKLGGLKNH
jgi:lysophospholipase L1-like esterase